MQIRRFAVWRKDIEHSTFNVFVMLWGISLLMHLNHRMHWFLSEPKIGLFISMLIFLLFPVWRVFLVVMLFQIWGAWRDMPTTANHWVYMLLINLTILSAFLVSGWRQKWKMDLDEWFKRVTPILRVMVVLLYLFVAWHKLNIDFFDTDVSCALHWYSRLVREPFFLPVPALETILSRTMLIWLVYGLVLGTGVFLLFARTWWLGILLGLLFHLPTGVFMWHFPSMIFALYFLFIPAEVRSRLITGANEKIGRWTRGKLHLLSALAIYVLLFTALTLLEHWLDVVMHHEGAPEVVEIIRKRLWIITVVAVLVSIGWSIVKHNYWRIRHGGLFRTRSLWLWIFPVMLIINSLAPYLGLKTTTTLSMWSNLRTENHQSNHLLLPADALRMFDYQDDVVRIIRSNDRQLDQEGRKGLLRPWHMLKRRVYELRQRGHSGIKIFFERNGEKLYTRRAELVSELTEPEPYLSQKLMHFRSFPAEGKFRCVW